MFIDFTIQPRLLGMASVPLKSVLKSESLFIDRSVEVKERSAAHNQSDSSQNRNDGLWPVVGNLKVVDHLGSFFQLMHII